MALPRQAARHACRWPLRTANSTRQSPCLAAQTRLRHYTKPTNPVSDLIKISPEVRHAVATNKPVVALESTIYTHGALGRDLPEILDSVVRQNGAVPATIGVLDGVPKVGLTPEEIDRMVDEGARKVSRRDFAYIVGAVSASALPIHLDMLAEMDG